MPTVRGCPRAVAVNPMDPHSQLSPTWPLCPLGPLFFHLKPPFHPLTFSGTCLKPGFFPGEQFPPCPPPPPGGRIRFPGHPHKGWGPNPAGSSGLWHISLSSSVPSVPPVPPTPTATPTVAPSLLPGTAPPLHLSARSPVSPARTLGLRCLLPSSLPHLLASAPAGPHGHIRRVPGSSFEPLPSFTAARSSPPGSRRRGWRKFTKLSGPPAQRLQGPVSHRGPPAPWESSHTSLSTSFP